MSRRYGQTMPNQLSAKPSAIPAIVLAAGASVRLGQPKQLLTLSASSHETLLGHTVRVAREAGVAPVFVILGAHAEEIQRNVQLEPCSVLLNPEWQEGMASSLRLGIRTIMESCPCASGALVVVCDQPALSAEHLRKLLAANAVSPEIPTASRYAGRDGVPVVLPRKMFPAMLMLAGDQGARAILRHGERTNSIEFVGGEWDVDRPEDLTGL